MRSPTLQHQTLQRPGFLVKSYNAFRVTQTRSTSAIKTLKPTIFHKSSSPIKITKINSLPASTESIDDETKDVLDTLYKTFKSADANGDGVLQKSEIRPLLERAMGGTETIDLHWLTDEDLDEIMAQYDTNNDGVISFEEFQVLAQDKVFLSAALSEYKAAFSAIDTGKNGKIGATELLTLFRTLGSPLQEYEKIVHLMQKYDLNKDGEIDFSEFLRLCRYEQALPLDEILQYAKIKAPTSSSSSSSSSMDVSLDKGAVTVFTSEAEFNAITEANPDKLIVLLASLTWCRPCKKVLPALNKCAAAYADNNTIFLRFNGNDNEDTKEFFKNKLKVRVTPSFFFFLGNELIGSCTGANSSRLEENLRNAIEKAGLVGDGMPERLYEPLPVETTTA